MSDSTAIGIAKVAAAMTELMREYASPADQAIQRGIDEAMRGVIRDHYVPTDRDAGPGPTKPHVNPFDTRLLVTPPQRGSGWQKDHEIGPVVKPGSMEERIQNGLIDQACGPPKPKADEQT